MRNTGIVMFILSTRTMTLYALHFTSLHRSIRRFLPSKLSEQQLRIRQRYLSQYINKRGYWLAEHHDLLRGHSVVAVVSTNRESQLSEPYVTQPVAIAYFWRGLAKTIKGVWEIYCLTSGHGDRITMTIADICISVMSMRVLCFMSVCNTVLSVCCLRIVCIPACVLLYVVCNFLCLLWA